MNRSAIPAALFCALLPWSGLAQSSSLIVIRYDANGKPVVEQKTETKSTVTSQGSSLIQVASKLNAQAQPVLSVESTVTTSQPATSVRRSESTTRVRDRQGNVRKTTKAVMTEKQVSADTVRTETEFQESRAGDLVATARMVETRRQKSDGSEYERLIEAKAGNGEFRPRQKVDSETREYSTGAKRTRTVESSFDLSGNARPTRETVERESAVFWGKQTVERIIRTIESNGNMKLDRVEVEERNLKATTGVLSEKVVKKPDPSLGLHNALVVTTSAGTATSGDPYKVTVTKEYPRNDRFGGPIVTQVEIERTIQRGDGTAYIEREFKVRDINGSLVTQSVTQIDVKGDGKQPPPPAAEEAPSGE